MLRRARLLGFFSFLTSFTCLFAVPTSAWANGRFPRAQAVLSIDDRLVLRTTFGLLLTRDGGRSFRWMCEQALGFDGTYDPPLAPARGGGVWVGIDRGLRLVRSECDVAEVPELSGQPIVDIAVEEASGWAVAVRAPPGAPAEVWHEGEAGRWIRKGNTPAGFQILTVDVAPSNVARLYATGANERGGARAHLFRSDDGGVSFAEVRAKLPRDGLLYVAGVDPVRPERLYVRQLVDDGSDLLLSTDGGGSFRKVFHFAGAMAGFARSTDGATLWIGSADPREGIERSRDHGETWEPMAKVSVACLRSDGKRLYVCSNPFTPGGFALGVSNDDGRTVSPSGTFDALLGPPECDGGPVEATCEERWPTLQTLLGKAGARLPTRAVERPRAASSPVDDSGASAKSPRQGRCGCRVVGSNAPAGWPFSMGIGLAALAWWRRRRVGTRERGRSLSAQ